MTYFANTFPQEQEKLLQTLSLHSLTPVNSLENLRDGFILSKILISHTRRPNLCKIIPSPSHLLSNWNDILRFIDLYLFEVILDIQPEEIISDLGVLFLIHKLVIDYLKKPRKRYAKLGSQSQNTSFSLGFLDKKKEEFGVNCQEKDEVYKWLEALRVVPRGVFIHEFLYRVRSGLSLFELIEKAFAAKIDGVYFRPQGICQCLWNINKALRYFRENKLIGVRYLYSSASLHEGIEKSIYGLLLDVKKIWEKSGEKSEGKTEYFKSFGKSIGINAKKNRNFEESIGMNAKKNKNFEESVGMNTKKNRNFEKSIGMNANKNWNLEESVGIDARKISRSMKNRIVDWIGQLGMLQYVFIGRELEKNTVRNGVLACRATEKAFRTKLHYNPKPFSEYCCLENLNLVLTYLNSRKNYGKLPVKLEQTSEKIGWEILWEIMNNCNAVFENCDDICLNNLEEQIIEWVQNLEILPIVPTTILDLIPYLKTGEFLVKVISKLFPKNSLKSTENNLKMTEKDLKNTDFFSKSPESMKNTIRSCLDLINSNLSVHGLKNASKTLVESEIHEGKLDSCLEVLEDLYLLSKADLTSSESQNIEKIHILESWLSSQGLSISLSGRILKPFRSGVLLCNLLESLSKTPLKSTIVHPQTTSEALQNIHSALSFLSTFPSFPIKFQYYDDQILLGNGKILRSLLQSISNLPINPSYLYF